MSTTTAPPDGHVSRICRLCPTVIRWTGDGWSHTAPLPGKPHVAHPPPLTTVRQPCGDRLFGWTCTLPADPHHDWRHRDEANGRWWTQSRRPPYSNREQIAAETAGES